MAKKKIPELTFEIVQDSCNLLYLTLIEYKRETYLTIIDNITESEILALVLDYAQQENVDVRMLLSACNQWYYGNSEKLPLTVHFARNGLTRTISPLMKTFDVNYVSRIVGRPFVFNMEPKKIKRRRIVPVPETVEIKLKKA